MMNDSPPPSPQTQETADEDKLKFVDGVANKAARNSESTEQTAPDGLETEDSSDQTDAKWQVNQTPTSSLDLVKSLKKSNKAASATNTPLRTAEKGSIESGTTDLSKENSAVVSDRKTTVTKPPRANRALNQDPVASAEGSTEQEINKGGESEQQKGAKRGLFSSDTADHNSSAPSSSTNNLTASSYTDLPADVKEEFFKEFECLRDENKRMKEEFTNSQEELTKRREEDAIITVVLHDLEDAFSQLCVIKDKAMDDLQKDINRLSLENEEYQNDLQSLEQSFDQALKRYNKARDSINLYKNNETVLRQELQKAHQQIVEEQKMYDTLKQYTEERFSEAEQQAQEKERTLKGNITRLEMECKRLKMANDALQLSYERKVKDNKEMNELCENLISKLAERESYD